MSTKRLVFGILGCFGGLFIHLVIGSLYQWGIINIYITSYHKTLDSTVTLQNNAIAFPIMMLCIGMTMRIGLIIVERVHTLILLTIVVLIQAGLIFASSYVSTMSLFIVVYGVLFGLISGLNFMVPVVQCNKFFPGKKMYVNGVILTGTGLGSVVFGLFSYSFLNPDKLSPIKGYYIENQDLQYIAQKVSECLRWLSLLYLIAGLLGVGLLAYVCIQNGKTQNQIQNQPYPNTNQSQSNQIEGVQNNFDRNQTKKQTNEVTQVNKQNQQIIGQEHSHNDLQKEADTNKNKNFKNIDSIQIGKQNQNQIKMPSFEQSQFQNRNIVQNQTPTNSPQNKPLLQPIQYPQTIFQAMKTSVAWMLVGISFFGTCGLFLLNGNYKTYVKQHMNNDELLTIIGVMNAIGNGFSRFFWNVLFNYTGYRFVILLNIIIQIVIYSVLRFAVLSEPAYLLLILMAGICMGGFLVMTPTVLQVIFGQAVGSNIYGVYWEVFALANLLQFAFVSGLTPHIEFNGVIYICLGMSIVSGLLVVFASLEAPWKNPQ